MSLLIFAYRKQEIIRRKNELNFKLLELEKHLMDLHSYSTSISDGTVSVNDLIHAPASMFNRMSIFAMYSNQSAMAGARENFGKMQASGMLNQMMASVKPEEQNAYKQMVMANLYKQGREEFSKKEEKILNEQDTKIQQQKAKLETQLKMLDSEEEKVTKAEDDAAKKAAPGYVA